MKVIDKLTIKLMITSAVGSLQSQYAYKNTYDCCN